VSVSDVLFTLDSLDRIGTVSYLGYLADGLTKEGYNVTLLTRTGGRAFPYLKESGISIRTLTLSRSHLFAPLFAPRFVKKLNPGLVQSCDWPSHLWTRLGTLTSLSSPMLALYLQQPPPSLFARSIVGHLHRRDVGICTPFRCVADKLLRLGLPHSKIYLVPLAARQQLFDQKRLEMPGIVQRLAADRQLIVACGTFTAKSQIKIIIWAIDILIHAGLDIYLVILGNGPEQQRWQQFTRDLHVQDHVQLLSNTTDFGVWLALAKLVWICSDASDSWFYLTSALAAGKSVIALDSPWVREIIRPGENGILIPNQDPVALAYHSRQCLESSCLRDHLSHNAASYAANNLSVKKLVQTFHNLYRDFLSRG
jgi:glycosyltransferase involved in cell wall biosynthesis